MARALAITPECLSCDAGGDATTSGGGTGTGGSTGTGPSIIPRALPDDEPRAGLNIIATPGPTPTPVGTSQLPSSSGPSVIPTPPGEPARAAALPWRKILIGVALVVAALLLGAPAKAKRA